MDEYDWLMEVIDREIDLNDCKKFDKGATRRLIYLEEIKKFFQDRINWASVNEIFEVLNERYKEYEEGCPKGSNAQIMFREMQNTIQAVSMKYWSS